MMFTASQPRAVSLYFTDMSALLPFVVLMTLLAAMDAPCVDSTAPRAVPAPHSS